MYIWELRNPDGGMLGFEFARAITEPFTEIIVHAPPSQLDVEVRTEEGDCVANSTGLKATESSPMARLVVSDGAVSRSQIWPSDDDLGKPVILPGGEVGILKTWWHSEDKKQWRWRLEFYNHV